MESNRRGKKRKKSKCCLYCNNAHCGKFLLLLMSAYENTNACKIFKLSNKASKCLSSSNKIDIYILDMWVFKNWIKFYQVLIIYPLKWTIIDILHAISKNLSTRPYFSSCSLVAQITDSHTYLFQVLSP